ncbi:MAG TPA: FlgD immunoglobulin-like domain containing protein [Desulfosporosinus sp.]|nr:FlgD immunoglobulin-like domain containing protein [Desulfosporosinus sp.]
METTLVIFLARLIYNLINGGTDGGAYVEDAGDLLENVGAATLTDFPYIPGDYYTQPCADVKYKAQVNRIRDWKVLFTKNDSNDQILQLTKAYLYTGDLPVVGLDVGLYFNYPIKKPDGNSFITTDNNPYGAHAITVVGYDDEIITPEGHGAFKFINSWGTDWGSNGFSYMTYPAYVNAVHAGYVFTDLVNMTSEQLPVKIQNNVNFNITFRGNGSYNFAIKDNVGNLVYRSDSLQSAGNVTSVQWLGNDSNGSLVSDGQYQLKLTTSKDGIEQSLYDGPFQKKARVSNASATISRLDGVIQSVIVHLTPSTDGKVNISVKNGNVTTAIFSNQTININQPIDYTISKELFDFNSVDLSKASIELIAQ